MTGSGCLKLDVIINGALLLLPRGGRIWKLDFFLFCDPLVKFSGNSVSICKRSTSSTKVVFSFHHLTLGFTLFWMSLITLPKHWPFLFLMSKWPGGTDTIVRALAKVMWLPILQLISCFYLQKPENKMWWKNSISQHVPTKLNWLIIQLFSSSEKSKEHCYRHLLLWNCEFCLSSIQLFNVERCYLLKLSLWRKSLLETYKQNYKSFYMLSDI